MNTFTVHNVHVTQAMITFAFPPIKSGENGNMKNDIFPSNLFILTRHCDIKTDVMPSSTQIFRSYLRQHYFLSAISIWLQWYNDLENCAIAVLAIENEKKKKNSELYRRSHKLSSNILNSKRSFYCCFFLLFIKFQFFRVSYKINLYFQSHKSEFKAESLSQCLVKKFVPYTLLLSSHARAIKPMVKNKTGNNYSSLCHVISCREFGICSQCILWIFIFR